MQENILQGNNLSLTIACVSLVYFQTAHKMMSLPSARTKKEQNYTTYKLPEYHSLAGTLAKLE